MKKELFANLYKTDTSRLPERDYSEPGSYFVTICTKGFKQCLGCVKDNAVVLNAYGKIIQQEMVNMGDNRVEIDAYVIMPNHVHMIITICENPRRDNSGIISPGRGLGNQIDSSGTVSTENLASGSTLDSSGTVSTEQMILRRNMLLPKAIGKFKMQTAKQINLLQNTPGKSFRQSNYYEHVIRDERDYNRISTYIINNPLKRKNDEYSI